MDLGFLAQEQPPEEDRVSPIFPLLGLAGGGYLGWRLDGAPGMAMGAAAGGVAGVILDRVFRASIGRAVRPAVSEIFDETFGAPSASEKEESG